MSNIKKVNSHYIQKALVDDVFDIEKSSKIYSYKNGEIIKKLSKDVFSSEKLFNRSQDDVKNIEIKMNEKLEQKVIGIFREIEDSSGEYLITYENAIMVRRYLIMTFLRANNMHVDLEEDIDKILDANYEIRFGASGIINDFFFKDSFIKIIDNPQPKMLLDMNVFLTIPFDTYVSNVMDIKTRSGSLPGYIFPISKSKSILLMNTKLVASFINDFLQKKQSTIRLNVLNSEIFFNNNNEVINPDGTREKAFKLSTNKIDATDFENKIINRDKKKYQYAWKIWKMDKNDYTILYLDNMNKYFSTFQGANNHELIFWNIDLTEKKVNKILSINQYVSLNNPSDVEYWSENSENKYKHKIWELCTPPLLTQITKLKLSIKKYKNSN